jgi:hypothetical protein
MTERRAQEVAIERQGKFEFYWLALTFTVLGLTVETAASAQEDGK